MALIAKPKTPPTAPAPRASSKDASRATADAGHAPSKSRSNAFDALFNKAKQSESSHQAEQLATKQRQAAARAKRSPQAEVARLRQAQRNAAPTQTVSRPAAIEETSIYPAASSYTEAEWSQYDDGQHLVFELRNMASKHSMLARIPKTEAMHGDDFIGAIFDRTIITTGTKTAPLAPEGYGTIPLQLGVLGGLAFVSFPPDRKLLSMYDPNKPCVIKSLKPRKAGASVTSAMGL